MRRIILTLFFCVCAVGAFAYNETVSAISFNPSRLGVYHMLKAVSTATLAGGLEAVNEMYISTRNDGTVRFQDEQEDHKCTVDGTTVKCTVMTSPSDEGNLNTIELIESLEGATATNANLQACLQKLPTSADTPFTGCNKEWDPLDTDGTNPTDSQGTSVIVQGGEFQAQKGYIHKFSNVGKLEVVAEKLLTVNDNFHHKGLSPEGDFKLGKITITRGSTPCGASGNRCKAYKWVQSGENKVLVVGAL